MNKYIIVFLLSIVCTAANYPGKLDSFIKENKGNYWYLKKYTPKGRIAFRIKETKEFSFKLNLEEKQYAFFYKGEGPFKVYLIESSGNEIEIGTSYNGELIIFENIMEEGEYTIKIYSPFCNSIYMEWGNY